jgi:threonine dehydrogenase-like Zn-dependent dehydrogenase
MDFLARMLLYGRLDVSPLLTHRYTGFEDIEGALLLMKNKPGDLIKPVITVA